jgi:hypothetical protein
MQAKIDNELYRETLDEWYGRDALTLGQQEDRFERWEQRVWAESRAPVVYHGRAPRSKRWVQRECRFLPEERRFYEVHGDLQAQADAWLDEHPSKAPKITYVEGDDAHGYLPTGEMRASTDRLDREYAQSWYDEREGEWRPGLVEYEYDRRAEAEAKGHIGGPWVGQTLPETRTAETREQGRERARELWKQLQIANRQRQAGRTPTALPEFKFSYDPEAKPLPMERPMSSQAKRERILHLMASLGIDPRDPEVARAVREAGYDVTLRALQQRVSA